MTFMSVYRNYYNRQIKKLQRKLIVKMFASLGQEIKVHDAVNVQELANLSGRGAAKSTCFIQASWCNQGEYLIAITDEGLLIQITLRKNETPICKQYLYLPPISAICFSKTINTRIACGAAHSKHMFLYDIEKVCIEQHFGNLPSQIKFIEYSTGDESIAVGCKNGQIFLYNGIKIVSSYFVSSSMSPLSAMLFHPSDLHLLTAASLQGNISIWDTSSDNQIFTYNANNAVVSITFNGNEVIFVDNQSWIYIINYITKKKKKTLKIEYDVSSIHFNQSFNDLLLSTKCGKIFRLDTNSGKLTLIFQQRYYCITNLVFTTADDQSLLKENVHYKKIYNHTLPSEKNDYRDCILKYSNANEESKNTKYTFINNMGKCQMKKIVGLDGNYFSTYLRERFSKLIGEMKNEYLKMRLDISGLFCHMEKEDRARWVEFNKNLSKLAENDGCSSVVYKSNRNV